MDGSFWNGSGAIAKFRPEITLLLPLHPTGRMLEMEKI
jgi:hypothetical protein